MDWKLEPPTEKQVAAIKNMQNALGIKMDIPTTKGECSGKISELKRAIQSNLEITGTISGRSTFFNEGEEDFFDEIY